MQTVELDFDSIKTPKELTQILKGTDLHKGDNLVLKTNDEKFIFILAIVVIAIAASGLFKDRKREKEGEKILNNILDKYDSADELEKDIEKEYGINIEFEIKNPLKDAFGLWKDYEIDAETLRKEAWLRKG